MSSDSVVLPLLHQILERLTLLEGRVGGGSGSNTTQSSSSAGATETTLPASVKAFDEYLTTYLTPFVDAAGKLGGDAQEAGKLVKEGWEELRQLILKASACKEPAQAKLPEVIGGMSSKMKAAGALIKRNEWEKHTKTISEGIQALNWVVVKPAPREFIESYIGGSDYWANGIRKEFRTTNPDQMKYVDSFKTLLLELIKYVKEHHLTGLTWNPRGVDVSEYSGAAAPVPAAPAAAPATAPAASVAITAATAAAPKADLFAALNREGAVTSGLKKVTKDMQTWRAEYQANNAPSVPAKAPAAPKPTASAANQVKGPPKLEFQEVGSKWVVENQSEAITIQIKGMRETVYIYGCVGATINIVGKCKSIVVDSCKKTHVHFETAFASCEVVNCQRMNIHCLQTVPSVAIDKTDGIVVHLPRTSLDSTVVASKSSEMNLSWPDENGDILERPIPEQYVHRIKGLSITADVSELYTH